MSALTGGGANDDGAMKWKKIRKSFKLMFGGGMVPIGATESPMTSLGAGAPAAPTAGCVAAAELTGVAMTTADEVYVDIPIEDLDGFDLEGDLQAYLRGEFTDAGAVANVDFTLHVKGFANGVPSGDAKVSADATVTFPALSGPASGSQFKTPEIGLNAPGVFANDARIVCAVTLADIGTATADLTFVKELVLVGTRRLCNEAGREMV